MSKLLNETVDWLISSLVSTALVGGGERSRSLWFKNDFINRKGRFFVLFPSDPIRCRVTNERPFDRLVRRRRALPPSLIPSLPPSHIRTGSRRIFLHRSILDPEWRHWQLLRLPRLRPSRPGIPFPGLVWSSPSSASRTPLTSSHRLRRRRRTGGGLRGSSGGTRRRPRSEARLYVSRTCCCCCWRWHQWHIGIPFSVQSVAASPLPLRIIALGQVEAAKREKKLHPTFCVAFVVNYDVGQGEVTTSSSSNRTKWEACSLTKLN